MNQYGEASWSELNPRCRRRRVFLLFHWSPRSRREQIQREGIRVGSEHACHSDGWRAPYTCWGDWPVFAWTYSAAQTSKRQLWDLWVVRSDRVGTITYRGDMRGQSPAELRTWQDIPASALAWVAEREHIPKRTRKTATKIVCDSH